MVGIVAGILLILVGYFIGKYIYQVRKKRANELLDEYDYTQNEGKNDNDNTNNAIVDENININ